VSAGNVLALLRGVGIEPSEQRAILRTFLEALTEWKRENPGRSCFGVVDADLGRCCCIDVETDQSSLPERLAAELATVEPGVVRIMFAGNDRTVVIAIRDVLHRADVTSRGVVS
jgi:hypothetical protein